MQWGAWSSRLMTLRVRSHILCINMKMSFGYWWEQDEHDESMTSDFDEVKWPWISLSDIQSSSLILSADSRVCAQIHETHFAEESVQYHARIDTLSEDIANNEKLTDFFVQKEAKYVLSIHFCSVWHDCFSGMLSCNANMRLNSLQRRMSWMQQCRKRIKSSRN